MRAKCALFVMWAATVAELRVLQDLLFLVLEFITVATDLIRRQVWCRA